MAVYGRPARWGWVFLNPCGSPAHSYYTFYGYCFRVFVFSLSCHCCICFSVIKFVIFSTFAAVLFVYLLVYVVQILADDNGEINYANEQRYAASDEVRFGRDRCAAREMMASTELPPFSRLTDHSRNNERPPPGGGQLVALKCVRSIGFDITNCHCHTGTCEARRITKIAVRCRSAISANSATEKKARRFLVDRR